MARMSGAQPMRVSGFWEANRSLKVGWNELEGTDFARGFGDSPSATREKENHHECRPESGADGCCEPRGGAA